MVQNENGLPRSTAERQGVASAGIAAWLEATERAGVELHSVVLLRHGHVIAEGWHRPYAPKRRHMLYSVSKSFTATAVGLAVGDGQLRLDDPLLPFFADEAPANPEENLARMRVRDLLTMRTGHAEDASAPFWDAEDGNWARAFLAQAVPHEPGTHFVYNSGASYMLSALVQKLAGRPILELLRERIFGPLGIGEATWETCPRGINSGGWGLSLTTEDLARFGQLYLQDGVWAGRRLLPAGWVEEASSALVPPGPEVENDWNQGYGFHLWRCRHGAYRADGAFGQMCVVLPEQDAVLALTGLVEEMQVELSPLWEHLLPAMSGQPLPDDDAATRQLSERLAGLALAHPRGEPSSALAPQISGRRYHFAENPLGIKALALNFSADSVALHIVDRWGEHELRCGLGTWHESATTYLQRRVWPVHLAAPSWPVAAWGAWTNPETFVARLCFYETPFTPTLTCRFHDGGRVTLEVAGRLGFGFYHPDGLAAEGRLME